MICTSVVVLTQRMDVPAGVTSTHDASRLPCNSFCCCLFDAAYGAQKYGVGLQVGCREHVAMTAVQGYHRTRHTTHVVGAGSTPVGPPYGRRAVRVTRRHANTSFFLQHLAVEPLLPPHGSHAALPRRKPAPLSDRKSHCLPQHSLRSQLPLIAPPPAPPPHHGDARRCRTPIALRQRRQTQKESVKHGTISPLHIPRRAPLRAARAWRGARAGPAPAPPRLAAARGRGGGTSARCP